MGAKEFGEYLKNLRTLKKMTIRKLELYSGVSNAYISQLERGLRGIPSPEILQKLSKPLGVDYEELMEKAGYISNPEEVPPHLKKVYEEGILEPIIDHLLKAVSKEFPDFTEDEIHDFSFNDKLRMFSNITDKGKNLKVVRNKDGTINVLYEVDEEYVLDLNDESLADKMDLYYDGMPLTNEEKVEFLAIARGIFSARRALREKK